MKKEFNSKKYWRSLDDQAKIYSLSYNKKDTSIFRLSVVLKEKIDEIILQKSIELALVKYEAFKVRMKSGIFWNYLEKNNKTPIVSEEKEYPFKKLNFRKNNDYLFKVTYLDKKINIDYFHVLTDANGGAEFFKEIIYRYLELKYKEELSFTEVKEHEIIKKSENAYIKNYNKNSGKAYNPPRAYTLKAEEWKDGKLVINHFNIDLKQLKNLSKEKQCSISELLTAMLAYSIYEGNYKKNNGKNPVNICIPINLKKYFPSETKSNFVSYMMISLNLKNSQNYSFENILDMVKTEFEKKLKFERIEETMSSNGKLINNFWVRNIPLILKRVLVILGSLELKKHFTTTLSNIGSIQIQEKYEKYIENFMIILSPDWAEKIRCGVCSYKDNLVITFGNVLKENSIEDNFKILLKKYNVVYDIIENNVN